MSTAADRLEVLRRHGLPAPQLLELVGPEASAVPHMVLSYVPGVALDSLLTDDLPARQRRRLLGDLIDIVAAIRSIPAASWPEPGPAWATLWNRLAEQAAGCRDLPADVREHHAGLAAAAAAVATSTRPRVFHGDLGGVNCRIDAGTGAVTGVLDWDSAAVGDPATDIAALLSGLGPRTAEELRGRSPLWRREEQRYQVYVATWPIQYFLWSQQEGDDGQVHAARGMLSRLAATAPR
jgi:aminoglycoside phosphotransferase (APT) family kinase protein